MLTFRRLSLLMIALATAACGDSGSPDPGDDLMIGRIENNQVGAPGTELPQDLGIRLTRGGAPQAGVTVTFSTSEGTITPTSVVTNSNGEATVSWTLPSGGTIPRAVAANASVEGNNVPYTAFVVPPANAVITITNNQFSPVPQTIQAGQTVTWVWQAGTVGHNVTPVGVEPARSGDPADGPRVYSATFGTSGNYTFYCQNHGTPGGTGMAGVVVVTPP